MNSIDDLEL